MFGTNKTPGSTPPLKKKQENTTNTNRIRILPSDEFERTLVKGAKQLVVQEALETSISVTENGRVFDVKNGEKPGSSLRKGGRWLLKLQKHVEPKIFLGGGSYGCILKIEQLAVIFREHQVVITSPNPPGFF